MAKFDLNTPMTGPDGEVFKQKDDKPILLRDQIYHAISGAGDERLTAEVKNRIFQISLKLYKGNVASFSAEDVALIKERAGLHSSPLVYGRICEALDPESMLPTEEANENAGESTQ